MREMHGYHQSSLICASDAQNTILQISAGTFLKICFSDYLLQSVFSAGTFFSDLRGQAQNTFNEAWLSLELEPCLHVYPSLGNNVKSCLIITLEI